jgi:BRCA1-associated protein
VCQTVWLLTVALTLKQALRLLASKETIPEDSTGSVALAEGIIHIYRTSGPGGISEPVEDGTVLAVLAVPSWMASADFLTFISGATETLLHLRIIR